MRSIGSVFGVALLLAATEPAAWGAGPYQARVVVPEAEVHSGPSAQMYATNRLHQGQVVTVLEDRGDGWLAVEPPPGSFSWINSRLVSKLRDNVLVVNTECEPLVGSEVYKERPTVKGPLVRRGSLLLSLGRSMTDQDGAWLSIAPPASERRFVRGADVAPLGPAVSPANNPITLVAGPASTNQTANASPLANHPLWLRAQEAKRAGRLTEAIALFDQLGQELRGVNDTQSLVCYNEAVYLRSTLRASSPAASNVDNGPAPASRLQPLPGPAPTNQAVTCYVPPSNNAAPGMHLGTPCAQTQTPERYVAPPAASAYPPAWSGEGKLRSSGYRIDGKSTYVLVGQNGQKLMYVTAEPGLDLSPYVGRAVDLHGQLVYRGDVRANYMTVDYISPAR